MNRIAGLDGIRAIAVLMVVVSHAGAWVDLEPSPWFHVVKGGASVSAFFVLSGFLISHLLIREFEENSRISLRDFYIRRSLRISWPRSSPGLAAFRDHWHPLHFYCSAAVVLSL